MKRVSSAWLGFIFTLACYSIPAQTPDAVTIKFAKADSIAELHASHSLYDLKSLSDKLTIPLSTDVEKFRAIYRWVCSNIEVDYDLVELHKRKKNKLPPEKLSRWNEKFNRQVFHTLLEQRRTVCTGYAYLIRELSYHAGLECKIVYGYAKSGGVSINKTSAVNHSWNSVKLDGQWYSCDATWSSGFFNLSTRSFVKKYNNKYFLADPSHFNSEHLEATEWVSDQATEIERSVF